MASSGSFDTNQYNNRGLTFSWWINSQDIGGNYTDIGWSLVGNGSGSGYYLSGAFNVRIAGTNVYSSSTRIELRNGTVVASGTHRLYHDNAGNCYFEAYAEAGIYTVAVNVSGSGGWSLNSIPRQATLTGADNFNDEGNPSITYSNPAGNSVSSLKACISLTGATDDVPYRDINKTGNSYTFNLTDRERDTLRKACTDSNSLNVMFFVATNIGGEIYHSILNRTMTIINGSPNFSEFTYKDTNNSVVNITRNNQILVKGLSTLQVQIASDNKMVANKKANPKNYVATIDTINKSTNYSTENLNIDLGTINAIGTQRLNVRAYDSRNNSALAYKDITVYDYSKPVINASIARLNNWENSTTLKVSGMYSKLTIDNNDKNTVISIQYRYRETGGNWSSWNNLTSTIADGKFTCNDVILSLDNSKAFEFEVKATDNLQTSTSTLNVDIGQAIFFISSNKKACYINNDKILTENEIYPVGSIYLSVNNTNPSKWFGGIWEQIAKGRTLVGVDTNDNDFNTVKKTGGSKYLQEHYHKDAINVNGNQTLETVGYLGAGNTAQYYVNTSGVKGVLTGNSGNLQPYFTCYIWCRTA